jgi:predicted short-subunit dehydrogenase-like oxidoreductase (DUF2520 family)
MHRSGAARCRGLPEFALPIPFAIVGPGRVGAALAERWQAAGLRCVGAHGRDAGRAAAFLATVGAGRPLAAAELRLAAVVALTVPDAVLPDLCASLAAQGAVRSCALWLHTSGALGLEPLAAAAAQGARIGALHPLAPIPDRSAGARSLQGRYALLEGQPSSLGLLRTLAERAGLRPVEASGPVDRDLYHAACALAANGTTALVGSAAALLERAAGLDPARAAALGGDLAGAACALVAERGAAAALSGPVVRGEADLVARHLAALRARGPLAAAATYTVLMREALRLARERGLAAAAAARIEAVLDGEALG